MSFECRVASSVAIGREPRDNVLLICEIVAYHVRDGLLRDGRIDPALLRPICRLGGTGFARLGEIINIARPRIPRWLNCVPRDTTGHIRCRLSGTSRVR